MSYDIEKGVMDTLADKAKDFNEKYGEKHGRVTAAKLKQVFDRGIGAYKTNPSSVRPNVTSKEQWAYARVNSFLEIYRGAKAANHDKDLLPDVQKAQYANDIFTTEMEAVARSYDMGLGGYTHVSEYNGQAVFMPAESHEAYLAYYGAEDDEEGYEDDQDEATAPSSERMAMLQMVIQEILKEDVQKAEYQGKTVTLNKPRRITGGNKKFEVFVQDGDKVKRVTFGDPNMQIRRDNPKARANFRARHSCDTATDKTSARYWSCRMWESDDTVSELTKTDFESRGEVTKMDDEKRIVYGYASVISKNGEPIVDRQGDIITAEELEKAASEFMLSSRIGKTMHSGEPTTTIIHSFPMTDEIKKAYQIESPYEAWLIAVKVHDDQTWDMVKRGELKDFSIGGKANRREL
jgi:hypothetical protein